MMNLRLALDSDADGIINVIDSCFKEYESEGVVIDLEDLDKELLCIRTTIDQQGGKFWVLEDEGSIIACIGTAPDEGDAYELKRLYMLAEYRGQGIADKLVKLIEDTALSGGAKEMILWTDSRFKRAHSFYIKKGYELKSETRHLGDISDTTEIKFSKTL